MNNNPIKFLRQKDYKFIRFIGQGGTGETVLLEDELIGEQFVCKKYSPHYEEFKPIYFNHFVDEIKLLHLLHHRNVVRVFNYYLYPEQVTGYILMEFIEGSTISDFIKENPEQLDAVFVQTVSGFRHLEESAILHRDIRPDNILVSNSGTVKIIDFGFGKKVLFEGDNSKSISLNWRYPVPKDFEQKTYDVCTEVYFIGKLFEEIIQENDIQNFSFGEILKKMIVINPEKRIGSFFEIDREIMEGNTNGVKFSLAERQSYQNFAHELMQIYAKIEEGTEYIKDIDVISDLLENCYRNSSLEEFVQNPPDVARCFIKGNYYYNRGTRLISVENLEKFVKFLRSVSIDKKRIIINNLWQRFDTIPRYEASVIPDDDDLPF